MKYLLHVIAAIAISVAGTQRAAAQCTPPTALATTSVTCDSVKFTWAGINGIHFYEYTVDQFVQPAGVVSSIYVPPTTAGWGGLMPYRTYYVHVRVGGCTSLSSWATISFVTPKCAAPQVLTYTPSGSTLKVKWNKSCAKSYHYQIKTAPATPTDTGMLTTADSATFTGLTAGTTYYVFLQSTCDSLGWDVKSSWSSKTIPTPGSNVNTYNITDANISIYPNPVADIVYLKTDGIVGKNAVAQLLSLDGKLLVTQQVSGVVTAINTTGLASGLYFIRYYDGQNYYTAKLSKE